MDATPQQLEALVILQDVDRIRIQSRLALEKLPQQAKAAEVRRKLEDVVVKMSQVGKILDQVKSEIKRITDEDSMLAGKQEELQESIEGASEDFRSVTNLTRELEGVAKRRETLQFELGKAEARLSEVSAVADQAAQARDTLAKQESDLAESFRNEGNALLAKAQQAQEERDKVIATLPDSLAKEYERVLERCGGVALGFVKEGACTACRTTIDPNRLLQMRKEAPLSHCPGCGRIVVIERNTQ
ncbi:MAG: hypothetical protein IJ131_04400 [Eggerthellaceae bacterium]|nr:hypothetical protein [Eggerthellaceae bacterium]